MTGALPVGRAEPAASVSDANAQASIETAIRIARIRLLAPAALNQASVRRPGFDRQLAALRGISADGRGSGAAAAGDVAVAIRAVWLAEEVDVEREAQALDNLDTQAPSGEMSPGDAYGKCRIDKWLWAARFYKTRSLATEAVAGGRVHVNGDRVKPAREIRVGETIDITLGGGLKRTVVVDALSDKRGPATAAQTLYSETPESIAERERALAERRAARPLGADLGTRPTKLDRRRLDALRRAQRRR